MAFVIALNGRFWKDYTSDFAANCWVADPSKAVRWDDRTVPDGIVEQWTMTEPKDEKGRPIKGVPLVPRMRMRFSHDTKQMEPADGAAVLGSMLTRYAVVVEI